jgi:hypothetical protein
MTTTTPATVGNPPPVGVRRAPGRRRRVRPAEAPLTDAPCLDRGASAEALQTEAAILELHCQARRQFCAWPSELAICEELEMARSTLSDHFRELRETGRIIRLTYDQFRSWMETQGEPVYRLEWPKGLRRIAGKVTVFLRRLPRPARDPLKLWPLGLPAPEGRPEDRAPDVRPSGRTAPDPSGAPSTKGIPKGMEKRTGRDSFVLSAVAEEAPRMPQETPTAPEPQEPAPTPEGPQAEPERRPTLPLEGDALADNLGMLKGPLPKTFKASAWWTLHDSGQLPAEWVGKPPGPRPVVDVLKPPPPPIPLGNPTRGAARGPERSAVETARIARISDACARIHGKAFADWRHAEAAAREIAGLVVATLDGTPEDTRQFALFFELVISGELKPEAVAEALRSALGANVAKPCGLFNFALTNKLKAAKHRA